MVEQTSTTVLEVELPSFFLVLLGSPSLVVLILPCSMVVRPLEGLKEEPVAFGLEAELLEEVELC